MLKFRRSIENYLILCQNSDNVQKLRHEDENFVTSFFFGQDILGKSLVV